MKDLFQKVQKGTELYFSSALGTEYQFSKRAVRRTRAWARPNPEQRTSASATQDEQNFKKEASSKKLTLPGVRDSSVQIAKEVLAVFNQEKTSRDFVTTHSPALRTEKYRGMSPHFPQLIPQHFFFQCLPPPLNLEG